MQGVIEANYTPYRNIRRRNKTILKQFSACFSMEFGQITNS